VRPFVTSLFSFALLVALSVGCRKGHRALQQAWSEVRSTAGCYHVEFGAWSDALPQDLSWVHAPPPLLLLDTILEPHPSDGFRLAPTNPASSPFASGWLLNGDDSIAVVWEGVQLRLGRRAQVLQGDAFAYGHSPGTEPQAKTTVVATPISCEKGRPLWPVR
jgi:hypothetical protein